MRRVVQPLRRLPGVAEGPVGDRPPRDAGRECGFIHACVQCESPIVPPAAGQSENRVDAAAHTTHAATSAVFLTPSLVARKRESQAALAFVCPCAGR